LKTQRNLTTEKPAKISLIGARDVCAVAGLGLVAWGLALVSVPAAIVTTGSILLGLAVIGSMRNRPPRRKR
jgi:hypothetical protein